MGAATISREGWRALGLGFMIAAVLTFLPFFGMLLNPLITIAHELGHAVVAWVFGYPAVPAFDFAYGGGVTSIEEEQRMWIVVVVYGLLAYAGWRVRRHIPTAVALVGIVVLYSFIVFADWADVLILAMGHGTELIIAGVFLYRAISGYAILQVDERPAYAMAAFVILFHDVSFAWGLTTSDFMRELYDEGKGGMLNDFTVVTMYVRGTTVADIGRWFLAGCGLTVVAAWLAHRYQHAIAGWWDRATAPADSRRLGEGRQTN
ncbi:MAG: hypothetical protein EXR93_05525 [Gemmatimonadetes bacterium]|nr:hypothetical protein [Gemmatimonadota bacterium]